MFQFAINAVNASLANYESLGRTGEVYLTNQDNLMITQSRLVPGNSVLRQRVDTQAPRAARISNHGSQVIEDYRGVRVLSSFEKFSFSGATWIIIAEIDEAEVLTEHFKKHRDHYISRIFKRSDAGVLAAQAADLTSANNVRVDINEFARNEPGQIAVTFGVATCTGVYITNPRKFGYLGHIYPTDRSYHSVLSWFLLELGLRLTDDAPVTFGGDLMANMLNQIKRYEVVPYELPSLRVTLVANHTNGFPLIIDQLLEAGLFLSQITILYNPESAYSNIYAAADGAPIRVQWQDSGEKSGYWRQPRTQTNLAKIVRNMLAARS